MRLNVTSDGTCSGTKITDMDTGATVQATELRIDVRPLRNRPVIAEVLVWTPVERLNWSGTFQSAKYRPRQLVCGRALSLPPMLVHLARIGRSVARYLRRTTCASDRDWSECDLFDED